MRIDRTLVVRALLAILAVSVIATLLTRPKSRAYTGVWLKDTIHQEIRFRNSEQNIDLAGLLFLPEGEGRFPGVVIVHGSGTSLRNNGWYITLVHYLQEHGVVVLLPDKRGSEQSGGEWRTASFEDLATDTMAAVNWLERHEAVNPGNIGVIGLSEGGHIAPLVANQKPDQAFVVSIVSSAIPMHELLVYEENYNLREFGFPPGLSNLFAYLGAWSLIYVRQKAHWDAIGNFDPAPHWEQVSVPALVLFGEDDTNVPSAKSAAVLRKLENPNIRVHIYPNSGHALETPVGIGDSIFREDALNDIVEFIQQTAGNPG